MSDKPNSSWWRRALGLDTFDVQELAPPSEPNSADERMRARLKARAEELQVAHDARVAVEMNVMPGLYLDVLAADTPRPHLAPHEQQYLREKLQRLVVDIATSSTREAAMVHVGYAYKFGELNAEQAHVVVDYLNRNELLGRIEVLAARVQAAEPPVPAAEVRAAQAEFEAAAAALEDDS